jgi:TetR/AcrR family tetracycline transcriptional repressor
VRWTQDDIIAAAFATLEQEGLERLSLRGVARALGAHLNSVSWYVKTKHSLIEMMADAILGTVDTETLPAEPIERVRTIIGRYRAAMLGHRDGGRLVAGTFNCTAKTLRVAEVIVGALLEAGFPEADAARLCWALVYFTLGLTQEEQTGLEQQTGLAGPELDAAAIAENPAYPALAKVGAQLLVHDPFDARFDFGVARLLDRPAAW